MITTATQRHLRKPGRPHLHVHFRDDHVGLSTIASPLDELKSKEEWNGIWYSCTEMKTMKREAREFCRLIVFKSNGKMVLNSQPRLSICSRSRGLEQFICSERKRRRFLTTKLIIRVGEKIRSTPEAAERLAAFAQGCNSWATKLAIEEGRRDFLNANYNESLDQISNDRKEYK
jgi:hypothetical protein